MRIVLSAVLLSFVAVATGCTSHSWTKGERVYAASYSEVFEKIPVECKKCGMKQKSIDPQAGTIVLSANRAADKIATGSLLNMVMGDEVIVKVQRIGPAATKVWIDSKARGQIGPDLGRTDRNVTALVSTLDKVWPVADQAEQRGEKRPGSPPATQPTPAPAPTPAATPVPAAAPVPAPAAATQPAPATQPVAQGSGQSPQGPEPS